VAIDRAVDRILMGHALIASFGGIPLIYMGDEIALLNDYSYVSNPDHAHDSRWIHRPRSCPARRSRRQGTRPTPGRGALERRGYGASCQPSPSDGCAPCNVAMRPPVGRVGRGPGWSPGPRLVGACRGTDRFPMSRVKTARGD
jgi:hypothetical protein